MKKRIKPNSRSGSTLTCTIGRKLNEVRSHKGFSIKALSDLSGVPTGSICELEQGKKSPTTDTLLKLSKALGVKMNFFLGGKK